MIALNLPKVAASVGMAGMLLLGTTGCATKKYARQQVAPVEARTTGLEKKSADHSSAINELENGLSKTDERAMEADKKAAAAGESASRANDAASRANDAATQAGSRADQARQVAESTGTRLNEVVENMDNYKLVTTEAVLFPVNRYTLSNDAKQVLDNAVAQLQNSKNYILEVQGFTDKTGSKDANVLLSQKRADAVVRYLTVEKKVSLRRIHILGVGAEEPVADNKTRAGRKQNRRVELKVFALDLGGPQRPGTAASSGISTDTGSANRTTGTTTNGQQVTPAPATAPPQD